MEEGAAVSAADRFGRKLGLGFADWGGSGGLHCISRCLPSLCWDGRRRNLRSTEERGFIECICSRITFCIYILVLSTIYVHLTYIPSIIIYLSCTENINLSGTNKLILN